MRVLVTGAAGFIGFHAVTALAGRGHEVTGLDSLNAYYDVRLKEARVERLRRLPGFGFRRADLGDRAAMVELFDAVRPERVLHLGAQAGVRYSLKNPEVYADANLTGFLNVLEGCRRHATGHLVYASSSSVYGANTRMPFSVSDPADHPLSLYAATKRANELMAHSYSHLYALPTTGLRFFTVYGPWGRPDMALFLFTQAILEGRPIDVFNEGRMKRDFTYVDDIVEGILRVLDRPPTANPDWDGAMPNPGSSRAPYRLYNMGNEQPVELLTVIQCLEKALGRTAQKRMLPMQPGDVPATWAEVSDLARDTGFRPATGIEEGVRRFVAWYREFYGV